MVIISYKIFRCKRRTADYMKALLVDYENVNGSNKWVMHSPKVSELTVGRGYWVSTFFILNPPLRSKFTQGYHFIGFIVHHNFNCTITVRH